MTVRHLLAMILLALGAATVFSPISAAQSTCEELEAEVEALTKRVEALEKRLAPAPRPAPTANRATTDSGREQALAFYRKIDGLVATGNINQAKRELAQYNEQNAGTDAAAWTRSLTRELEVVGKPTPTDWSIEKWFQGESDINLDGRRPTLLVFWESWCPHCKNEVPKMQKVYDDYKDKGLQVLGVTRITRSATEESVQAFVTESGVSYPIAKETGDLAGYFNVKGIPAAAFVQNGKIVWRGHPVRLTDELLDIWF
jgi:thiol-disulfide isomerase/thioredoxin